MPKITDFSLSFTVMIRRHSSQLCPHLTTGLVSARVRRSCESFLMLRFTALLGGPDRFPLSNIILPKRNNLTTAPLCALQLKRSSFLSAHI